MRKELETLAKELELEKAPLLVEVGEERAWDPLLGEWVPVPVYQAFLVSGYSQVDIGCQGDIGS